MTLSGQMWYNVGIFRHNLPYIYLEVFEAMRRWLSLALALALLAASVPGFLDVIPARAEEFVDNETMEDAILLAEDAGDTGLTVDDGNLPEADAEPVPEAEIEPEAAPAEIETGEAQYARTRDEGAPLYAGVEIESPFAVVSGGQVALVLDFGAARAKIALYTDHGVTVGYAEAADLIPMTAEDTSAFMDTLTGDIPVALYQDDLDRPLAYAPCVFTGEAEYDEQADEAAQSAEDAEASEPEEPEASEAPAEETESPAEPSDETEPSAEPGDETVSPAEGEEEEPVAKADAALAKGVVSGAKMNHPELVIGVKEKYAGLSVVAIPSGQAMKVKSWRTSKAKYVKVNETTGEITGAKRGSATVYATLANGQEVACEVTVKKAPSKVTVTPNSLIMGEGGMTTQLTYELPKNSASLAMRFTSSNTAVARVSSTGVITSVGPGEATITVSAFNGKSGRKGRCKVTVKAAPAKIIFPANPINIAVGQTYKLNPSVLAKDNSVTDGALSMVVHASSPDMGCVRLNQKTGELTGVRKGTAIIRAVTYNNVATRITVNVASAPQGVTLNAVTLSIGVKETYTGLTAKLILPAGETTCANTLTWSSSEKRYVSVDPVTGAITGLKKGTSVITVETVNGKKAQCKVTVVNAPKKISLSPAKGALMVGESAQYSVSFPKRTGGTVSFSSSDPRKAAIDSRTGIVTAISAGEVTITAKAFNGRSDTAKLTIHPGSVQPSTDVKVAEKLEYVIRVAQSKLGAPYVYGSFGPNSFDCSGFTTYCFRQIGVELKHSAHTQGYDTTYPRIMKASDLVRGDLVFFNTVNDGDDDLVDHSGIYLGNGKFIHASSSGKKVIISTLASGYYSRVFSWGMRVLS